MKKVIALFSIFLVALLAACSSSGSDEKASGKNDEKDGSSEIRIGYVSILSNAPGIVAEKEGLFKDELNAKTFAFGAGPELYQALAADEIDVAYAGIPALVNWSSRGLPLKVIAKVSEGKLGVVVGKDSDINSVKQLKGQVVASAAKGSGVDMITRGIVLPEVGLSDKGVSIREFKQGNIESAIDSSQAKAGVLNEPFLTYAKLHGKKQIAEERDPGLVIVASEKALKEKPEAIHKFIEVHKEAIKYLDEYKQESNEALVKEFKIKQVGDKTPEQVIEQANESIKYDWKFNKGDFEYYKQLADAAYKLKYIKNKMDVMELFDLNFVKGVNSGA